MKAHYLQHVPFEGLGSIETWLHAAGYAITSTPLFASAPLPDPDLIDFLIVMGGPMSVNDEDEFPWLIHEKRFILASIGAGKPVLGVCLGAQLIACALGTRVYRNPVQEIGWFPIRGIPSPDRTSFEFPPSVEAFHWHGETFDLPAGAIRLADSDGCDNQAFQYGRSVMGLQFHLETTPDSARELVDNCREEIVPGKYIQTEAEILGAAPEKYRVMNGLMDNILSFLGGANQGDRAAAESRRL